MTTCTNEDLTTPTHCVMCDAPTSHRDGWCEKCRGDPDKTHGSRRWQFKRLSRRPLPVQVGDGGRIAEPLPCPECQYNLQTIPIDSKCPECGSEIQTMIARRLLALAPLHWLNTMKSGAINMATGVVLYLGLSLLASVGIFFVPLALLVMGMFVLSICLFVLGMLRLTTADPGAAPDAPGERIARWAYRAIMLLVVLFFSSFFLAIGINVSGANQLIWFALLMLTHVVGLSSYLFALTAITYRLDALNARLSHKTPSLGSGILWKAMIPVNGLVFITLVMAVLLAGVDIDSEIALFALILSATLVMLGHLALLVWLAIVASHRACLFRTAGRIARARVEHALSATRRHPSTAAE